MDTHKNNYEQAIVIEYLYKLMTGKLKKCFANHNLKAIKRDRKSRELSKSAINIVQALVKITDSEIEENVDIDEWETKSEEMTC